MCVVCVCSEKLSPGLHRDGGGGECGGDQEAAADPAQSAQ